MKRTQNRPLHELHETKNSHKQQQQQNKKKQHTKYAHIQIDYHVQTTHTLTYTHTICLKHTIDKTYQWVYCVRNRLLSHALFHRSHRHYSHIQLKLKPTNMQLRR